MNCEINILSTNIKLETITNCLQILTIIIAIFGTIYQIHCIKNSYLTSPILPISLTIALILRLPNQICIALEHENGWLSVIGTIISILSFMYLSYITYNIDK